MKRLLICLAAMLAATIAVPSSALADNIVPPVFPVPASIFPSGADAQYVAYEGNLRYSCDFAVDCTLGGPALHSTDAVRLGRIWGWVERFNWTGEKHSAYFEVYDNIYADAAHAKAASEDLMSQLKMLQAVEASPPIMPVSTNLRTSNANLDPSQGYMLTFTVGSQEIEADTIYTKSDHVARKTARYDIIHAVRLLASQLCAKAVPQCP